jgi:hypothetical protein
MPGYIPVNLHVLMVLVDPLRRRWVTTEEHRRLPHLPTPHADAPPTMEIKHQGRREHSESCRAAPRQRRPEVTNDDC